VLQGRFKAIVVDRDSYLLELCRYVVLNPVCAKQARKADTYPWSSYRATAGFAPTPPYLTIDWLLSQFSHPRRQRVAARPTLSQLFGARIQTDRVRRNEAIRRAHLDHGYSLSEIGRAVGLHYATISRLANPPDGV
jgi:putative transposase